MLPSYELGFYALVVTCAVLYSGSGIFEASRGNAPVTSPGGSPARQDGCKVPAFTAADTSSRSLALIVAENSLEILSEGIFAFLPCCFLVPISNCSGQEAVGCLRCPGSAETGSQHPAYTGLIPFCVCSFLGVSFVCLFVLVWDFFCLFGVF